MTLEDLSNTKAYSNNGLFSWEILSSRKFFNNHFFKFLFSKTNWMILQALVVLCLFLIIFSVIPNKSILLFCISSYLVLFFRRNVFGFDGSDQVLQIIFISLFFFYLFPGLKFQKFFLHFISLQILIAYFFSGLNKIKGPLWRQGKALRLILSTEGFGNKRAFEFLSSQREMSFLLNWVTILFQLLFPLAMFANQEVLILVLVIGFLFHISIGVLMGLNTFVWAFFATYPCIIFSNITLKEFLLETIIII